MDNLQSERESAGPEQTPAPRADRKKTTTQSVDAPRLLNDAISQHRMGRPAEAETLCQEILSARRDHFDATHLLAVVQQQQGRLTEAVETYARAVALRPNEAVALNNYGAALSQLKRFDEALASYDRALAIRPKYAEALGNRGTALLEIGRFDDAVASFDQALALKPDDASTLFRRGSVLAQLNRSEEALASLHHALAVKPDYADALELRGATLNKLRRFEEALSSLDRALAIRPDFVGALANRGVALAEMKRFDEALASYDKAITLNPNHIGALNNRGIVLGELKRPVEALESLDRALAIKPDYSDAHNNRGNVLRDLGRLEEGLAAYDRATACRPDYYDALSNRGNALVDLVRFDEGLASYDRSIELCPDQPHHRFNRALLLLRLGRFPEGWREYEWRRKKPDWREQKFAVPEWAGESVKEKRVLLHCEQGLGDSIQFVRFAQAVAKRGAKVFLAAPQRLAALLERLEGEVRIVKDGDEPPEVDLQLPLLSVPFVLGLGLEGIPSRVPYLSADTLRTDLWASRLPTAGFRVGIAWQGNPNAPIDRGRSIPLRAFAPLGRIPGVRLISLQKDAGVDQIANLPAGMEVETLDADFDAGPEAFLDCAAVMMNLDLVITSDTAVAHLAGALGRPVWIVLKRVPDWRWLLDREDSPWYPTARLFRQDRAGDWDEVFIRIAAELAQLAQEKTLRPRPSAVVSIPASIGELIDKITILRIKSERIAEPEKLANVQRELALLKEVRRRCAAITPALATLEFQLETINRELWDIEDGIRDCERLSEFGANFIELARAVYRTNDRRSAIKRDISKLCGSTIIEEKSYH